MLIECGVWFSRLAVAGVFGLSAIGKLADRVATAEAAREFGVPIRWSAAVAILLPVSEGVIAVAVLPAPTAVAAAGAAIVLLVVLTAAVLRLLAAGSRPACACFGAASAEPIGGATVTRNGVLLLVAAVAATGSALRPGVPGDLPVPTWAGLAVIAVLATWQVWTQGRVAMLRRQVDRLALADLGREGLPPGAAAPEFELADTHGGRVALADLVADGRSLLLVFVHAECDICAVLARELPRWQARRSGALTIAVVGNGDVESYAAWARAHDLGDLRVLVQQGNEAALRYRVRGTPSGVLVGPDGRIAAAVGRGPMAIRELMITADGPARRRDPGLERSSRP
ncbi:peroxiredoxin family protein [Nocardia sp. alder85J]|uniref:peroxiredoxin family protein n=1 Tax=Nocardia sp. alder85J TaxID=2862949 RepID=UPI001CD6304C|nr:MauE/DoxX family redox-associated membrane protein [Nocardia sp. alder85J]MCX4092386.1 redoxin domain-containing protein [Nocardia sp. alder85J]